MHSVGRMYAQIVLFDGFDPLDVVAPFEVLAAGGALSGGGLDVRLVSAEGPRRVVSGTLGLALEASAGLDPELPGYVVVPGASGPIEGDPDVVDTIPVLLARVGETEVRSPAPGEVRSLEKREGETVAPGDALAELGADKNHVWEALRGLYLVGVPEDLEAVQHFARPVPGMPETVVQQAKLTAQAIEAKGRK